MPSAEKNCKTCNFIYSFVCKINNLKIVKLLHIHTKHPGFVGLVWVGAKLSICMIVWIKEQDKVQQPVNGENTCDAALYL